MDPEQYFRLWNYIKFERAHFAKPYTPEMEAGLPDLEERESLIEKAVATGNSPEATKQLDAYFNEVGELFREIDTKLKEFSIALRYQTAPLKTILAQVRHV